MALRDLTFDGVLSAISEFDRMGRVDFLREHGFGEARGYFLIHKGKPYDSKAIAGVAHRFSPPGVLLKAEEFNGGEQGAALLLRQLGFHVPGPDDLVVSGLPFQPGATYNRVRDIHDVYDGQRQGGISTPKACPFIFLFTGEDGEEFGYSDGFQDDGSFAYTGEGQIGDMDFVRGNLAIRDHIANGRELLLFEKLRRSGSYRFIDHFTCDGFGYATGPDRTGAQRRIIIFNLKRPLNGGNSLNEATVSASTLSLEELRRRAIDDAVEQPKRKEGRRSFIERSASVKAYVLKRAKGRCESCEKPAPFLRANDEPYLEPHHTRRLADGGPDHPLWVGAICPTCHREIHHGKNGPARNTELQTRVSQIEERYPQETKGPSGAVVVPSPQQP